MGMHHVEVPLPSDIPARLQEGGQVPRASSPPAARAAELSDQLSQGIILKRDGKSSPSLLCK